MLHASAEWPVEAPGDLSGGFGRRNTSGLFPRQAPVCLATED